MPIKFCKNPYRLNGKEIITTSMITEIKKLKHAQGVISVPGDKSISHRAVILGALAEGTSHISGFLMGEDCLATIDCFRKMGINIDIDGDSVTVEGKGLKGLKKPEEILYTANSGTTTRLLLGILSAQDFDAEITGDDSLCKRPMSRVTIPLSMMGAKLQNTYCPIHVYGKNLKGIKYDMPVASAQVKSAIMLAGLYADGETVINEKENTRNHTELMLKAMGADVTTEGKTVRVKKAERINPIDITVPGDISSAAFFLVLGSVLPNSEICLKNVGINPTRTGILDVLTDMGADFDIANEAISGGEMTADITVRSAKLKGTRVSGAIIPRLIDELPAIAAAALFAEGETVIADAQELKVKETNRIRAVVDEFSRAGADIKETPDGMIIKGGKRLTGADFKTYGDHRMAMCLTIAAQLADGRCTLDDALCTAVSYPDYFEDFCSLDRE